MQNNAYVAGGGSSVIGRPVVRLEDAALLTGTARFVDDLSFAGTLEAAFVRSPHPHALIKGIDASAALALPGVTAVLTMDDLRPVVASDRLPLQFRSAQLPSDVTPFVLAHEEVAFAGEAVAVVIATSRYVAEDAATLVAVDYEPLAAVSDCRAAIAPGAPQARRVRTSNLLVTLKQSYGDIAAAFHLEHLETTAFQCRRGNRKTAGPCAASQRHHRFVLDEQQEIRERPVGEPPLHEGALQQQHLAVTAPSQVHDQQRRTHGRAASRARRKNANPATAKRPANAASPLWPNAWCTGIPANIATNAANPLTTASPPRRYGDASGSSSKKVISAPSKGPPIMPTSRSTT